jgi:hypothetical protein
MKLPLLLFLILLAKNFKNLQMNQLEVNFKVKCNKKIKIKTNDATLSTQITRSGQGTSEEKFLGIKHS